MKLSGQIGLEVAVIILIALAMILFGLLTGYREVQILCDRGSWLWEHYKKQFYWFTNQNDKKEKDKDSFHISNGVVFVIASLSFALNIVLIFGLAWWWTFPIAVPIWFFLFHVRNLALHIIFKKEPLWGYLYGNLEFINKIIRR